jgi:hypothetical protein
MSPRACLSFSFRRNMKEPSVSVFWCRQKIVSTWEIYGSHSDGTEQWSLLGYYAVCLRKYEYSLAFPKIMLPFNFKVKQSKKTTTTWLRHKRIAWSRLKSQSCVWMLWSSYEMRNRQSHTKNWRTVPWIFQVSKTRRLVVYWRFGEYWSNDS